MFDRIYDFKFIMTTEKTEGELAFLEHKFAFRTIHNQRYIVNVEEYSFNVFVIKFHLKAHTDSLNKYRVLTNLDYAPSIIGTCIEIMLEYYRKNPYSSFGFIGINSLFEASRKNTKRFRIYRRIMENTFSPIHFTHYVYEKESAYLMLNKDNSESDLLAKVEKMFQKGYDFEN